MKGWKDERMDERMKGWKDEKNKINIPWSKGSLIRRHNHVSPCSTHSLTPHPSSPPSSTLYTPPTPVSTIEHWVEGRDTPSRTGGAVWPGGKRSWELNSCLLGVSMQWISKQNKNIFIYQIFKFVRLFFFFKVQNVVFEPYFTYISKNNKSNFIKSCSVANYTIHSVS